MRYTTMERILKGKKENEEVNPWVQPQNKSLGNGLIACQGTLFPFAGCGPGEMVMGLHQDCILVQDRMAESYMLRDGLQDRIEALAWTFVLTHQASVSSSFRCSSSRSRIALCCTTGRVFFFRRGGWVWNDTLA